MRVILFKNSRVSDVKKSAEVIADPEKAKVLVDPMRREMMRLLAERPMTEKELAITLGLSDPSIGYHLKILKESGLIEIARKEVEEHGIVQKFYQTKVLAYFIDGRVMPLEIERYFMPVSLERARGIIATLKIITGGPEQVSTEELEKFAKILNSAIVRVVSKYSKNWNGDHEELVNMIYRDALIYLLNKTDLLPEKVQNLFINAGKRRK
jgi:DNA-binding transcriptional ArsR family regulator